MARYIDAEALIERLKFKRDTDNIDRNKYAGLECAIAQCKKSPTADLVPKSEYDAVVSAVDNSTKEFLKLHDEYQDANREIERLKGILDSYAFQYGTATDKQAIIDHERAEVAREIFKEFERLMENNEVWFGQTDEMREEFAKLKKKYTEEK